MAERVHRVEDGGCGGQLRVIYVREADFMTRTWRPVARACLRCRLVLWTEPGGLSLREVAARTGRSVALVRKHVERGKLRATYLGSRRVVSEHDFAQYVRATEASAWIDPS